MPTHFNSCSIPEFIRERYTDATETAISAAAVEARLRGSSVVTVVDLLAGLCLEEDSRAQRVAELKANASYLRWLTRVSPLPHRAIGNNNVEPALDLDASKALSLAMSEADRDGEYWIDSDHLLRGLLRFDCDASFSLLKIDVTLHSARRRSREDRRKHPLIDNLDRNVIRYRLRRTLVVWVSPLLSAVCYLYILIQLVGINLHFKFK